MKHFLVILGITALVWLGVSMSEDNTYPMQVRVQMSGFDTVRYALLRADTVLNVDATMSGFNAMLQGIINPRPELKVDLSEESSSVAIDDLEQPLRRCFIGAKQVVCERDSVRAILSERHSRIYQPRLDQVEFGFAEQCGLFGEPTVQPSNVILYGPKEELDKIDEIRVEPTVITNISQNSTYRLNLEPVWNRYIDVHPSTSKVSVYVPVEPFVEQEYRVPIQVEGADSTVSLRLYPSEVTVRAWVPQRELVKHPDIKVYIDYDEALKGSGNVTPRLAEFPSFVRPRSIEPGVIQTVVIK